MKLKHVKSLHTCIFRVTRYQSRYNVLVSLVSLDFRPIVSGPPTLRRRSHLTSMTRNMAPIVVTRNTVPHVLETCGREAYHSPGEDIVVFASFFCRLFHVRDAHNLLPFVDPTLLQVRWRIFAKGWQMEPCLPPTHTIPSNDQHSENIRLCGVEEAWSHGRIRRTTPCE